MKAAKKKSVKNSLQIGDSRLLNIMEQKWVR